MKKHFMYFFAILLVVGLVFSATSCDVFKKEEETEVTTLPDKQELVNDKDPLAKYYDEMLNKAYSVRPAASVERKLDVKDIAVFKRGETEKDKSLDVLKTAIEQAKNYIMTDIKKLKIEPNSTEYGEDLSALLYDIALRNLDDVENVQFAEKTVKDPDTNEEKIELNESVIIVSLTDSEYPAKDGSKIARLFKPLDFEKALKEFEKTEEYLKIGNKEDFSISYEDCTISIEVNRKDDTIGVITLTKNLIITAPATAVGKLEEHGDIDISFRLIDTTRFAFDWTDPNAEIESEE